MKILPVDYRSNVQAKIDKLFSPLQLLLFVRRSKRDVMHCARGDVSKLPIRALNYIYVRTCRSFVQRETATPSFLRNQIKAKHCQQLLRRFRSLHFQRRRVKCANGKFARYTAFKVKIDIVQMSGGNQFEQQ